MNDPRVLIVEPNEEVRRTLALTLEDIFPSLSLKKTENVYTALWEAVEFSPTAVLINYNTVNKNSGPLMIRLKKTVPRAKFIVFYSMDLVDYEDALKEKLLSEPGFNGAVILRIEKLFSDVQSVIQN